MKKSGFIFILIFLSGMIYTVFQYMPILEEDVEYQTTELAKKSCEDDHSGDENDESDVDDALNIFFQFNFANSYFKTHPRSVNKEDYSSFFQKITIPPPKIMV